MSAAGTTAEVGELSAGGGALSGRCAVVSGAAGGIGSAIVRALLAQGASVHGLDRDAAAQQRLASSLASAARYQAHLVDLADRRDCDHMLASLLPELVGGCDILINNAAVSRLVDFETSDDALLDAVFAINFDAAFRITRALLPALRASGRAAVVNIASELALIGQPGYSVYSGSKGAILAWSRALAIELAADGIRVNVVCPGPIDTAMLQEEFVTLGDPVAARSAEVGTVPLGRLGLPQEIAAVVVFLASAASFTTGAAWTVDGGKTAR